MKEKNTGFINFAHRGASEYAPENTMLAFNLGIFMGANGIETDVQITKDNVPVLFHDNTLERVTGQAGCIGDYTYEELRRFDVIHGEHFDKIQKFEDFLIHFGFRSLTFAIELKEAKAAEPAADLIRKYGVEAKVTVTSFKYDALLAIRAYAPELKTGYLTKQVDDELLVRMKADGIGEICPLGSIVTSESVKAWHEAGFNVRAWGIANDQRMRHAYEAGVDGMTVNFPDKLQSYIKGEHYEPKM